MSCRHFDRSNVMSIRGWLVVGAIVALGPCARPVLTAGQSSTAQSVASLSEQQIYDRYRDWTSSVPVDQRGPGLSALYRQHLEKQGIPAAEIDRQLAIIEREGRRLEADRWNAFFTADRPRFNIMANAF